MDNAAIHNSEETLPLLTAILDIVGVRLVFLPKYAPELNPCELVFAQSKRFIRSSSHDGDFAGKIVESFQRVSVANVFAYYQKCLLKFDED
jgi:transposase